jgi:hypothetical protein
MSEEALRPIPVYVRLCGNGGAECRELRFRIPEDISQADLLPSNFAIDGNTAVSSVTSYIADDGRKVRLAQALHEQQRDLVKWFMDRGYVPRFE